MHSMESKMSIDENILKNIVGLLYPPKIEHSLIINTQKQISNICLRRVVLKVEISK